MSVSQRVEVVHGHHGTHGDDTTSGINDLDQISHRASRRSAVQLSYSRLKLARWSCEGMERRALLAQRSIPRRTRLTVLLAQRIQGPGRHHCGTIPPAHHDGPVSIHAVWNGHRDFKTFCREAGPTSCFWPVERRSAPCARAALLTSAARASRGGQTGSDAPEWPPS